jgi:hypothetical protein
VPDEASDPILDALWQKVLDAWDDERTHAAALEHGVRSCALPSLASRYRALLSDPDKRDLARRKLDAIVIAATQMLVSTKTPSPGRVPLPITLSAFAVCVLLLGWLALAIWGRR